MEERAKMPSTPTHEAIESEGDELVFMDLHRFEYSSDSSLDLAQPALERALSSSPETHTSAPDIAAAVTTAVKDAMKMQAEMLAKFLGKQ